MLLLKEIPGQEKESLDTIQKQKAPLCQKKKIPEKIRQVFHLLKERALRKAMQVKEKNSSQASSTH